MGVMKDDRVGSVDGTHVYARVPTNIQQVFQVESIVALKMW